MRILIVGGFGFVGGRLAVHMMQTGHQIVLGSRQFQMPPNWLPKVEVTQLEWHDGAALQQSCTHIDVVIHAAGMNSHECAADPVAALEFNGVATARLVAAASRAGVKRFIYLSTAHVYADPLVGMITENTCPRNFHPYATSHIAGENAVFAANQRKEIEGLVLRISNAFGAPVRPEVNCWSLLVNDLCKQALQTHKLTLRSNGLQHRDFIALSEVCNIIEKIANQKEIYKDICVFNVGTGTSKSVLSMAQCIQERCMQIFNFEPPIESMLSGTDITHPNLSYLTDNLSSISITVSEKDNEVEIDKLLYFCNFMNDQTR
jgi:UDP-glucose 4-epimerase